MCSFYRKAEIGDWGTYWSRNYMGFVFMNSFNAGLWRNRVEQ